MPIYEVEAPDGRILEIEGNQPPSEKELDDIFASVGSTQQPTHPKKAGVDLTPSGLINQFTNCCYNLRCFCFTFSASR